MLEQLALGTRMVDLVIALTAAEGVALALYNKRTGRGIPLRDFGLNLVSGLLLMLALRSHIAGAGWGWSAAFLAASGLAHATDLWSRWKH